MNSWENHDNSSESGVIVSHDGLLCLIGGGAVDDNALDDLHVSGAILVAADGGADHLLAKGLVPKAVIGDMDSVSPDAQAAFADCLHPIAEQDSTDFEKCLRHVAARAIVGLGFLGPGTDHALAAMHALVIHSGGPVILQSDSDIVFHLPAERAVNIDLPKDTRVSLFPLAPVRCRATGLQWSLDGLTLAPLGRIGTSNKACGGMMSLEAQSAGLLCILPAEFRDRVLQSLILAH